MFDANVKSTHPHTCVMKYHSMFHMELKPEVLSVLTIKMPFKDDAIFTNIDNQGLDKYVIGG